MMKLFGVLAAAAALAQPAPPPSAERFDMVVRSDFFAGFDGDADRLKKAMDVCERAIAEYPAHAEALGDYERVLELQASYFSTFGDHPKGELLFGLAEGYSRLGDTDKARAYFNRLLADAPGSGQTTKAKQWLADGTFSKTQGLGCVGRHK